MVIDSLQNFIIYQSVHPLFLTVARFIDNHPLETLLPGKLEIANGIRVITDEYLTKDSCEKQVEAHRKNIDIQVVIKGSEKIGLCNRSNCSVITSYNSDKDIEWLTGTVDYVTLHAGEFSVLFPRDAHMPGIHPCSQPIAVKKVVFKVPV